MEAPELEPTFLHAYLGWGLRHEGDDQLELEGSVVDWPCEAAFLAVAAVAVAAVGDQDLVGG